LFTVLNDIFPFVLFWKTSLVGNWKYLADYDDQKLIRHVSSHLACFHGGNWLFGIFNFSRLEVSNFILFPGGKLLNNQTIIDIALDLVDSCWNTYSSTT